MKELFLTIMWCCVVGVGAAQNTYQFKPNWKVGDKHVATTYHYEEKFENGEMEETYEDTLVVWYKVSGMTKSYYELEVTLESPVWQGAIELAEEKSLKKDLEKYKYLVAKYHVAQLTGEFTLQNWKELSEQVNNSCEQIDALFEKKLPEMASLTGLLWMSVKKSFSTESRVKNTLDKELNYLMVVFDKTFTVGDTLVRTETEANPFQPGATLSVNHLTILESVNEQAGTCVVKTQVEMDLTAFLELMKGMMKGLGEAFDADEEKMEETSQQFDEMTFDIENYQLIDFNYKTGWPMRVEEVVNITAGVPGEMGRESTKRVTIIE